MINLLLTALVLTSSPLDDRLSIELKSATAEQTFASFAGILGVELELHPDVDQTVSIGLENVTLKTALTASCESVFADWRLTETALEVFPEDLSQARIDSGISSVDMDQKVNLALEGAPASASFGSLGKILRLAILLDPSLVDRTITANLESARLSEVLDTFCAQIECDWRVDGSQLLVTAQDTTLSD